MFQGDKDFYYISLWNLLYVFGCECRFLVCNLAAADFFMGLYLGFLAIVDASTLGEFRQFAISWQFSSACQVFLLNYFTNLK